MKEEKKKNYFFIFFKKLIKRIKLRTLLMLMLLLSTNTFAWFIYATRVSNNISAYVKSWNVNFIVDDNDVEETISFDVDYIYPGMQTQTQTIEATNSGDTDAYLEYNIVSLRVLNHSYEVGNNVTEEELENIIAGYPFTLNIEIENGYMTSLGDSSQINFSLEWPYESGNDELDTTWGHNAYTYHAANPNTSSIALVIKVMATQVNDTQSSETELEEEPITSE